MEVYIGTIMQFAYPDGRGIKGWALCAGQILPISHNDALFSLLGTAFGGDGIHNFALPDLRPKDEHGNAIKINTGDMYNGKPYLPSYIAIQGIYPSWD